ncbi:MAG: precorrin-2 C(20)-methyltransferase [Thermodesulfobacteriota bacterium]
MQESRESKPGILYGLGVGPGDPELLPVKTARILQEVDVVFSASSTKNKYSLATSIASNYLSENTSVRLLPFPMTKDRQEAEKAWEQHSQEIVTQLEQGYNVAFLTMGDPLTYSTYGYLLKIIKRDYPHIQIRTIPGITSYQAGAAAVNTPLVEGEENLLLLSGVEGGQGLRKITEKVDNVVFLKAYKNIHDIVDTLQESGHGKHSVGILRCGFPEEEIVWNIQELKDKPPKYWTLVIDKQNGEK